MKLLEKRFSVLQIISVLSLCIVLFQVIENPYSLKITLAIAAFCAVVFVVIALLLQAGDNKKIVKNLFGNPIQREEAMRKLHKLDLLSLSQLIAFDKAYFDEYCKQVIHFEDSNHYLITRFDFRSPQDYFVREIVPNLLEKTIVEKYNNEISEVLEQLIVLIQNDYTEPISERLAKLLNATISKGVKERFILLAQNDQPHLSKVAEHLASMSSSQTTRSTLSDKFESLLTVELFSKHITFEKETLPGKILSNSYQGETPFYEGLVRRFIIKASYYKLQNYRGAKTLQGILENIQETLEKRGFNISY